MKINNKIIIVLALAIIAMAFAFCEYQKQEAFENGYKKAIEEATLVSSNDEGYILNFEGELYNYTF